MDDLIAGPSGVKRPLFQFTGMTALNSSSTIPGSTIPEGQLHLAGPTEPLDAAHWPVRGDLAHIRLAGKVFVPHYAVPMARRVSAAGAALRAANRSDADVRDELPGGAVFNVLDMAGDWAWGQVGDDGFVGYLPLNVLEAA